MTVVGPDPVFLVGRVVLAAGLGYLALGNVLDFSGSVAYAEHKGVPAPAIAVASATALLLAGALSLLVGLAPRLGAVAIVLFLAGVTPMMHDFWNHEGEARQNEQIHFVKNLALLGAGLLLAALVEWPYALT